MKKYIIFVLTTFMFSALSGVALADKITIQNEVSLEKQQGNAAASPVKKESRLSSKRIKDKADADQTSANSSNNERMIRYKRFSDGEGEEKAKN